MAYFVARLARTVEQMSAVLAAPHERRKNVKSLRQCPGLSPEARASLIARAQAGEDVYAYSSAAGWNVWIVNARVRPDEVAA